MYRLDFLRQTRAGSRASRTGDDRRKGPAVDRREGVEAGWAMGRAVRDVTRPGPRTVHIKVRRNT